MVTRVSWSIAGTVAFAAWQWAMLFLVSRLAPDVEDVGRLALALAITTPVSMLTSMALRQIAATDVNNAHSDLRYLSIRVLGSGIGLVVCALLAVPHFGSALFAIVLTCALLKMVESWSDICFGLHQRALRDDRVGRSLFLKAGTQTVIFAAFIVASGDLSVSLFAVTCSAFFMFLWFDLPRSVSQGFNVEMRRELVSASEALRGLAWIAAPAGAAAAMVSLGTSIPRMQLAFFFGTESVGQFAALMAVFVPALLLVNAVVQPFQAQIALHFSRGEFKLAGNLLVPPMCLAVVLPMVPVLLFSFAHVDLAAALFGPTFGVSADRLFLATIANVIVACTGVLNYCVAATHGFKVQAFASAVSVAVLLPLGMWLIASWGISGAIVSLGITCAIQAAVYAVHLCRCCNPSRQLAAMRL